MRACGDLQGFAAAATLIVAVVMFVAAIAANTHPRLASVAVVRYTAVVAEPALLAPSFKATRRDEPRPNERLPTRPRRSATAASEAISWPDSRWCRWAKRQHRVTPGQSWGALSGAQISTWKRRRCDSFFCQPNALEARGTYHCVPLPLPDSTSARRLEEDVPADHRVVYDENERAVEHEVHRTAMAIGSAKSAVLHTRTLQLRIGPVDRRQMKAQAKGEAAHHHHFHLGSLSMRSTRRD